MEGEPRKSAFRLLLLNLSENISEKDFKNIKFLCDKYISKSRMEKITYIIELFDELISRHIIRFDKTDQLRRLIEKCTDKKLEIIQMIDQFEAGECHQITSQTSFTTELRAP